MTINTEVSVGDILTIGALTLTLITILIAWQKDRVLRLKEYSTPIRRSAGLIIAKVERWKILSSQFFDEIEPLLTDADVMLIEKKDVTVVRDSLWRNLVAARALYNQKILNEQIEIAFTELYGYDLRIQALFTEAMTQLQAIDKAIQEMLLELTQLNVTAASEPFQSAKLGNNLRKSSSVVSQLNGSLMDQIVGPFRSEMTKLIKATDRELASKRVNISDPADIFPKVDQEGINLLNREFGKLDRQKRLLELCQRYPRELSPVSLLEFLDSMSADRTTGIGIPRKLGRHFLLGND